MPRIPLRVEQFDATTQQALRDLSERLPEHVHVQSEAADVWVSYPDALGEAGVREVIAGALAEPEGGTPGVFLVPPD